MGQFHQLIVSKITKETENAVSIYFDTPSDLSAAFKFEAGQYLTLKCSINGEEVRRAYSISSAEDSGELRVSVKKVEGGKMSTYLVDSLKAGDQIEVMPPEGRFTLEDSNDYVFIAGGSGITPILSLIKKAQLKHTNIKLLYANKSEAETMFKEELNTMLNDQLAVSYFNSNEDHRLDEEKLNEAFSSLKNSSTKIYICGPQGLIELSKEVANRHVDSNNIHIEYFASPDANNKSESKPDTPALESGEIQLIIDGETHQLKVEAHETVLEAGERIGIDPPFSCQSGVCTTCRAKVISGEVEMENNFGLGQDEIDEGYILTCISKPKGDGLVVSWDED